MRLEGLDSQHEAIVNKAYAQASWHSSTIKQLVQQCMQTQTEQQDKGEQRSKQVRVNSHGNVSTRNINLHSVTIIRLAVRCQNTQLQQMLRHS